MAVIYIKDLVVEGKHGVHQREKDHPQRFSITTELTIDTAKAGVSDDLNDTLNWSALRDVITDTVQNNSFNLVERLAREVGDRLILSDVRIQKLIVSIDKLDAFETGMPGVRLEVNPPTDG
jgi:FolB domain-containing protein